MSNRHQQIADAVVAVINAAEPIAGVTAVRKSRPETDRATLTTATIQVICSTFSCEPADRTRKRYHYGIDVGVQQATDPDDLTTFSSQHDWLSTIRAMFEMQRLTGLTIASWERTETVAGAEAGYAPEHLDMQRVFTGVLRFTFMVIE